MTLLCTNYCLNPSFEVNVTDDWTLGGTGASRAQDATQYFVGTKSCKLTSGSDATYIYATTGVSVPNNSTVTIHARVRTAVNPANKIFLYIMHLGGAYENRGQALATTAANGAWEYLTVSWLNNTGLAETDTFVLMSIFNDSATYCYIDACQLELGPATAYTDGSLGGQCAWTGDANNSTSTRTLATQAAAGAQTNTGTATRLMLFSRTVLTGAQTNTGTAAKFMTLQRTALTGAITFGGTLVRATRKVLAGVFTPSGILDWLAPRKLIARFRDYFLRAEQVDHALTAETRDYILTAPKRD